MSEQEEKLLLERKGKVAYITINNPKKKNAIEVPMIYKFLEFLDEVDADPKVRCLVIRSTGDDVFCAGWDLAMFESVDQKHIDILLNDGARISKKIHFLKKPNAMIAKWIYYIILEINAIIIKSLEEKGNEQ